ncbi:hypothetical protein LMH87_002631 [Akanthomyces muscarius]|uniref:Uncharacterized protein n=1 Tax=Akanthomyces muscarius TaxID=2231603 RepID=A0A9W8UJM6_AKAMU|nr:hypothetical protein LMH87_002631 [Akanthomyces muscarius]KAJ4148149.1 hypothetical protein LMH87_002631 [Akanthomyces muscarius]
MPYDRYGSDGLQVSREPDSYPEIVHKPSQAFHPASYNVQSQDFTAKETPTSVRNLRQPTICGITSGGSSTSVAQASPSSTSSETASSHSTSSAAPGSPSPTIVHSSDCPTSNGTSYNSMSFASGNNGPIPDGAENGLKFVKVCGTSLRSGSNIAQGVVATLDECIDLCASYNFWSGTTNCTSASYNSIII